MDDLPIMEPNELPLHNITEPFHSRAYQLEMFEHSLKANTIVVMGTGTGKTHVAGLRIDVELKRQPRKQVWFTVPNSGLAMQQLRFLTSQLPEYSIKSMTGQDKVDAWNALVWRTVLKDVNIVVATPQVLLDALRNAYVNLRRISLMVFDEAHHCRDNGPSALIMRTFYHPQKALSGREDLPHILGLTASPCFTIESASLKQLESNLDAKCRSPTLTVEEYARYVQRAVLVRRFFRHVSRESSSLLQHLREIVLTTTPHLDPYYARLLTAVQNGDMESAMKLHKFEKCGQTPAIISLKKFLGHAEHLHENIGPWACDMYILACTSNWSSNLFEVNAYHEPHLIRDHPFINERLAPIRCLNRVASNPFDEILSSKALALINFLAAECRKDVTVIVFVERRPVAWALCELLKSHPSLSMYGIFSYVGHSVVKSTELYYSCASKQQELDFMKFREGSKSICIATSVAEEGIDVQAVNIVVRYDDPKQFVAYLQSRGRARQEHSKIVCFQDLNEAPGKYEKWDAFEKQLDEQYHKQQEELEGRLAIERVVEESSESYQVESTGALLNLDSSVSRLAHFCSKTTLPSIPIYIPSRESGVAISFRVSLPSSVPPPYREAHSCRAWRSERMARRDAACHAVKALHSAGLINDHLLPFEEEEDETESLRHEKKLRQVLPEYQVWPLLDGEPMYFAYRIEVAHEQCKYLTLIMILPVELSGTLRFSIEESRLRRTDITISPMGRSVSLDTLKARETTHLLLESAFQVGSASRSLYDSERLSLFVGPELEDAQLCSQPVELEEFLHRHSWLLNLQPLLIWKETRPRPYLWYPPHTFRKNNKDECLVAAKQVRKLQMFTQTLGTAKGKISPPQDEEIPIAKLEARGLATVYGPVVLLLPSILHFMGAALRAQHANQTILRPIGFTNLELLTPALIAKSASGTYNYERLEFLGDVCLKYLTSIQMFFNHKHGTEGKLTRESHKIFGNNRLEQATLERGLASYITTEVAAQEHWKLPKVQHNVEDPVMRSVLSKTLADVVESIIGAAFLDGEQSGEGLARCLSALQLFIPEVDWQLPETHIQRDPKLISEVTEPSILQISVNQMLNCDFRNSVLLTEALTHSTDVVTQRVLDRLEFLGDAILDQVVKVELFKYRDLNANRLTTCRHALVSHHFLAYIALGISYEQVTQKPVAASDRKTALTKNTKRLDLTDLIRFQHISDREPIIAARSKRNTISHEIEIQLAAGRFPWTLLSSLNAPKVCSDIIESLLAASYLDCKGSLSECEELLRRFGLMDLLKRMATNADFEVRTPLTKLRELCAEKHIALKIKARCEKAESSPIYTGEACLEKNVTITRTASCLDEAKYVVAEAALEFLAMLNQAQSPEAVPMEH